MKSMTCVVAALGVAGLISIGIAVADAEAKSHTQVQFGGTLGKMMNTFGGKAAREGMSSTTWVKGNQKLERQGETTGQLIDLAAEKVYTIDFGDKRYSVMTFEEIRKQMREAIENAKKSSGGKAETGEGGVEYEIDVEVEQTNSRRKFAQQECKDTKVIVTARQKGKTLEAAGGTVITSTLCMGKRSPELAEIDAFNMRYAKALALDAALGADAATAAMAIAQAPALSKAMQAFREKQHAFEGSAYATEIKVDVVPAPGGAGGGGGASLGQAAGKLGKMFKKKDDGGAEGAKGGTERRNVMTSATEVRELSAEVSADEVKIPAGFTLKS